MINQYMTDTISAIATPIGNGGVSIIRLSGEKAFEIIDKIFSSQNLIAGKIYHGWIMENGEKWKETGIGSGRGPITVVDMDTKEYWQGSDQ